jgi:hypothetical protein
MIANMSDWYDAGNPGDSRLTGFHIRNCIFDRVMQNELVIPGETDWSDLLFQIYLSASTDWRDAFQMHGVTIRDQTRSASQMYISIFQGANPTGTQSLQWFMTNHPNNVSNITVTSSSLFTSERTFGTALMPPQIPTYFTPNFAANGVSLTTVSAGDSGSGTSLIVNDSTWFRDPRYVSNDGSICTLHCNGANRQYTAINYATNTITMSSGFARSSGLAVNRSITSGSTPNRGAVR